MVSLPKVRISQLVKVYISADSTEVMREDILKLSHDHKVAGHFKTKKTIDRVRNNYYWSGYRNDIDKWCRTVANTLVEEFICRYGIPSEIHTDQGRQFEAKLFQELCRLLEINKTRTTPYYPQSDGMIERFNRTLEAMLALVVAPDQRDWDCWLP
ncbi:hypothetical protein BSL78_16415 [Apostichopus japonicus]|uniref:Integrase catalytic domain-containing protein n=1 Tax=Stichopus japonicus TaxID=307972 RepID=A0A2G8KFF9_STIJA|nr:hypothetical protein BSL78_16415 [Apostichopus japonicus]